MTARGDMRNGDPSKWKWSTINWGGKRSPSDLDAVLEVCGSFLVLECKQPGEELKRGQEILLQQLARLPQFKVLIVRGFPETSEPLTVEVMGPDGIGPVKPCNRTQFQEFVDAWIRRAQSQVAY